MPRLRSAGFVAGTTDPYLWVCSVCDRVFFALEHIIRKNVSDLHKIDTDFRKHCDEKHPEDRVIRQSQRITVTMYRAGN
jgi:hypothetical protein